MYGWMNRDAGMENVVILTSKDLHKNKSMPFRTQKGARIHGKKCVPPQKKVVPEYAGSYGHPLQYTIYCTIKGVQVQKNTCFFKHKNEIYEMLDRKRTIPGFLGKDV